MVNNTRSKEGEVGNSKKTLGGKNESSAPLSDGSGLRRSTRAQNSSSPGKVRKSERLGKKTPPSTPSSKKKNGGPIPPRNSNKAPSPSQKRKVEKETGKSKRLKQHDRVDEKDKERKTLKENAEDATGQGMESSGDEVGTKRKKRLDARRYREMFKPLKKFIPPGEFVYYVVF